MSKSFYLEMLLFSTINIMEISDIKNKLTKEQFIFFSRLNDRLNCRIQFFGSIARKDFTVGTSDIDVQIFSENSQSDLLLLSHYLQENNVSFSSDFFTLNPDPLHKVSGIKYMINLPFKSDILVFDVDNEHILTMQYKRALNLPVIYLLILKMLKVWLKLTLISQQTFLSLKNKIWNHYNNLNITEKHFKIMTEPEYKRFYTNSSIKSHLMHPACYPHSIVFYR